MSLSSKSSVQIASEANLPSNRPGRSQSKRTPTSLHVFCLYGIIRMIVPQGQVYLVAAAAVDTKSLFIVFVKRGVPRTSLNGLLGFFSWRERSTDTIWRWYGMI